LYDPQQRPTASQALQYPFFQTNNALPPPLSTAKPLPSTFTRRPVVKTEAELREEERALAKKAQEELGRGQNFTVPEVNILHETAEPARSYSTYVQKKLGGEAVAGQITNIPDPTVLPKINAASNQNNSNFLSEEENEFLFGLGGGSGAVGGHSSSLSKDHRNSSNDDATTASTADTTPNHLYGGSSSLTNVPSSDKSPRLMMKPHPPSHSQQPSSVLSNYPNEFKTYSASAYNPSLQSGGGIHKESSHTTASSSSATNNNLHPITMKGSLLTGNSSSSHDEYGGGGGGGAASYGIPGNARNQYNDDSLFQDSSIMSDGNALSK
jgi:hypothetical protein